MKSNRRRIWELLRDDGPLSLRAIAEHLGIEVAEVKEKLNELWTAGLVKKLRLPDPITGQLVDLAEINHKVGYDDAAIDRCLAQRPEPPPAPEPAAEDSQHCDLSHDLQCQKILEHLARHGDATIDEVQAATGIYEGSLRWRFKELEADGVIRRTPRERKTRRGGNATVYEPTGQRRLL